ncbi:MAG: PAS domain S-box protein [Lautropia sp.]|nr:PAS domain S-box protein [Lautropia sp.]
MKAAETRDAASTDTAFDDQKPPLPAPRNAEEASAWRTWRFLGMAHVAGLMIFIVMMAGFLWYVSTIEQQERRSALTRDADWAQQTLKLSLRELQDNLSRLAPLWLASQTLPALIDGSAQSPDRFMEGSPPVLYLALSRPDGKLSSVYPGAGVLVSHTLEAGDITQAGSATLLPGFERSRPDSARQSAFQSSRQSWQPSFSRPLLIPGGEVVTELYLPIIQGRRLTGILIAGIGLDRLLQTAVPANVSAKYRFSIIDAHDNTLVSTTSNRRIDPRASHLLPLRPPGSGLQLRAAPYMDDAPGLAERLTQLGLFTLSLTSILSLILLWRSAHDRFHIEAERDRLFLLSQDVFCVMRPDGTLVRGNPAFVDYFGNDTADTRFWEHVHPDDRADTIQTLASTDERIGPLECRVRYRNAWRWLSWSISVDRRSPESLRYAVAHDITSRKHIEHALTTETTFRRAMEDSISTGMRVIDQDGRITYVNRAFCKLLGFEAEELIGQLPPYPYWIPEEYELSLTYINLIISGRAPHSGIQTRVRHKDGRIIDVRIYVSPLIDDQGQQAGWMASVTDITEPNRIRAELSAAQERFNTVLNELGSAVSVASIDPQPEGDRPWRANAACSTMPSAPAPTAATGTLYQAVDTAFRVSPAIQTPATMADAAITPGDSGPPAIHDDAVLDPPPEAKPALLFCNRQYRALFGEHIEGHLALLKGWPSEDHWVGEEVHVPAIDRWFEVRVQLIRWVDGKTAQLVVATDITALRPIWEQQKQQQEQLQQTSRLVTMGEMASSIAHELNQPLTAISNYSQGLAKRLRQPTGIEPEVFSETLDKIARQAQRAAAVIRRVRDFVKRNVSEQQAVTVDSILTEALGLAEIAAKRYGAAISIDVQPNLPLLLADRILIEQVLLNLLKNAIDAMRGHPHPALTLEVSANQGQVEFSVADQGPGLAEEMQTRVFEPFFTTKPEGMGMGLNICRSIIESHAGRLWVEPNQPHGCIFRFTLPEYVPDSSIIVGGTPAWTSESQETDDSPNT